MAPVPSFIAKYQVVDRLGEGGMGTLYLARDPMLDRFVAIKVLRGDFDDPEVRERFTREARTVSNLIHDNIVIIYEYGDFQGQPFIAMQYIAGESLAELIRRRAHVSLERKLHMIDEVCAGMSVAHRAKIVHRDLKPANIMVDADRGQIKILDFGIARNVEANATLFTQVIGTPSYMSPEQAGGRRVDYRSDIFAIGVVAYELLSYRKAFDGESAFEIQHKILHDDPVPLAEVCQGIDPEIVRIVEKAIAKDAAARYQDLKAMRSDLARAIERMTSESQAATLLVTPPVSGAPGVATPIPSNLEKRRAHQIQIHLDAASAALREDKYDAVIDSCEHILLLDPHHRKAIALLEQARVGVERVELERHLTEARAHLRSGALTMAEEELHAAAKIASSAPAVLALQREIQQARRDVERAMEQAAATEAALERARAALDEGAYESALRAVSEALARTPDSTEARTLKAKATAAIEARARERELERVAMKAVADARARFDGGDHASAIRALESFSPPHQIVATALSGLRKQHAAIEEQRRREEERRQAEEARQRERVELVSRLLSTGRDRLRDEDYDGALQAIAEAEGLEPRFAGLSDLRDQVLAQQAAARTAAERQRAIAAHVTEAERLLAARELDGALTAVNAALALDAADSRASQVATRIRHAIDERRRDDERRRAEEARQRERVERVSRLLSTGRDRLRVADYDGALQAIAEAESLESRFAGLSDLRDQVLAQQAVANAAAERQRAIAAHVTEAERLLAARELDAALTAVNAALALDAGDARASRLAERIRQAIDVRRRDAEEREAQAREALRLKQQEEERRRRVAALIASGEQRLASGDYDAALAAVADAERLAPSNPEVARLREKTQAAREAAEAAAREAARITREVAEHVGAAERLFKRLALEQALERAENALALAPGDRTVQRLHATIQRALEDRAKAQAAKREAELEAERRASETVDRRLEQTLRREPSKEEHPEYATHVTGTGAGAAMASEELNATLVSVRSAKGLDTAPAGVIALPSPLKNSAPTSSKVLWRKPAAIAAGLALIAGAIASMVMTHRPKPQVPLSEATLVIDAVPWARIERIVDAKGTARPLPEQSATPLALHMPPGEYRVTLVGPPPTQERRELPITVSGDKPTLTVTPFGEVRVEDYFRTAKLLP